MSRRNPLFLLLIVLAGMGATPPLALASVGAKTTTHVVAEKSSKRGSTGVYLSTRLRTGHWYRLEIVSSGRYKIDASGFENYTFVVRKQLSQNMKPIPHLSGRTPYRYTLRQPVSGHLGEWDLAVTAQIRSRHPLTVRVRDMGK